MNRVSSIEVDNTTPRTVGRGTGADADDPAPASILLVEDEGIVAQDLKETLTRLGYRVSGIASEGTQAVKMAQELEPELVVMDVSLRGEIDGIQAARLIQERSQVPVIFLTGHSDPATLQRAVLTGPLGYIVKPFQEIELRCALAGAMLVAALVTLAVGAFRRRATRDARR